MAADEWPTLILPGLGDSGPEHWQTLWQQRHPHWRRVMQRDWDHPVRDEWVHTLDAAIATSPAPPILIAHSMGCLVVTHWACCSSATARGAFLAAVPDPDGPHYPPTAQGFKPVPLERLPFPSLVVSSTDDPFGSVAYAQHCATRWGSEFVEIGPAGHINSESGHGDWPIGLQLLDRLLKSVNSS